MATVSPQTPQEKAESFRQLLETFTNAREYFQRCFNRKFHELPGETRDEFMGMLALLREYSAGEDAEDAAEPEKESDLKIYFRRAARVFHPDILPDDLREEGEVCFAKANEYHAASNIAGLQAMVLSWIAQHFDTCDESARAFFNEQSRTIDDRFNEVNAEATNLLWMGFQLDTMGPIIFEQFIETQIQLMEQQLLRQQRTRKPKDVDALSLPPRPE